MYALTRLAARTLQAPTAAAAACTCKRGNICSEHAKARGHSRDSVDLGASKFKIKVPN